MTEYFISYYDSEHTLRYRCRLGNMTDEEIVEFRQESGFDNFPDYRLRSVDDLSLEIIEKKKEHIQARKNFESLPDWGYGEQGILAMRSFLFTAQEVMNPRLKLESRYGEPPYVPCFINENVASGFYKMEMTIIEESILSKIEALKGEERKLCAGIVDEADLLEEDTERLKKILAEKKELKAELKKKRQELRQLQEKVIMKIAPQVIIYESLAAPSFTDITGVESATDTKKPTKKPKSKTLKPPKTTMEWNKLIAGIYENYPEARTFNSKRLLAYLKNYAGELGVEIDITDSYIRHMKVWKENAAQRASGKTRYGYNSGDHAETDDKELEEAKQRTELHKGLEAAKRQVGLR